MVRPMICLRYESCTETEGPYKERLTEKHDDADPRVLASEWSGCPRPAAQ